MVDIFRNIHTDGCMVYLDQKRIKMICRQAEYMRVLGDLQVGRFRDREALKSAKRTFRAVRNRKDRY